MKITLLFVSLMCILPTIAQSQQYGAFGPVPECNCDPSVPMPKRQSSTQDDSVISAPLVPIFSQSELKLIKRKMAAKIVAQAGRETDRRALSQEMGYAVLILETTLDSDGGVIKAEVYRRPVKADAQDTIDLAISAVHRAAPYRGITQGVHGLKIMQTFLFLENRKFYLDALNE